jgi:hypothetical protein
MVGRMYSYATAGATVGFGGDIVGLKQYLESRRGAHHVPPRLCMS